MENKTFQFAFGELKLNVSQIENVMGYKDGDNRELVTSLIEEILEESRQICTIKAQYSIFPGVKFEEDNKALEISNCILNIKRIVYNQIKKSDSVAVFLCTAGEEIGMQSRRAMQERDLLRGFVYDIVGSEIVEAAADIMQAELKKEVISTGRKITNRYSPGYCGWDVAEQHKLFELVPDNFCGIRLTDSALMVPVKSVSGIIGIGENVKYNSYTCNLCDLKDCIYRKAREKKA
jgi:hypothetical protein